MSSQAPEGSTSASKPSSSDQTIRLKGFAAGCASGLTKLGVGHPFDTIKLRLQCSPPGTFKGPLDCLLRTIRTEGPRALYKGASPPAVGWIMSDALLLGSMHNYRLWLERWETGGTIEEGGRGGRLSLGGHMMAGTMAGWTVSTLMSPIELLKAKLQMQTTGTKLYSGPIDCAVQIVRAQGVLGLWHGFGGTLLFRSWIGVLYGTYEVVLRGCRSIPVESRWRPSEGMAVFLAGGLGSSTFWCFSFPFDSVKNRLMADSITNPRYPTWRSAAQQLWKEGKIKAVYRGFVPGILRAFPTVGCSMWIWETSMRLMGAETLAE